MEWIALSIFWTTGARTILAGQCKTTWIVNILLRPTQGRHSRPKFLELGSWSLSPVPARSKAWSQARGEPAGYFTSLAEIWTRNYQEEIQLVVRVVGRPFANLLGRTPGSLPRITNTPYSYELLLTNMLVDYLQIPWVSTPAITNTF